MTKTTHLPNGNTLIIQSVAGGSFTNVAERRPDGSTAYTFTNRLESVAMRTYTERGGK